MTLMAILPVGLGEGAARGGVEGGPGGFVDVGPERPFQLVVGLVGPGEVGVAHKETLAVVVGVDEPAGHVIGGTGTNLAGGGVVNVQALDFHHRLPSFCGRTSTSGSPKTMKRFPAPVFFRSSSPMARSGFMRAVSTVSLP